MKDFVDLQINGCHGIDFNVTNLSQQAWAFACTKLFESGTSRFLPTVITDSLEAMVGKIERLADFCEQKWEAGSQPIGIHIEGPFISPVPGYIGAHPKSHAITASKDTAKRLVDAGRGWVRMVTLAPEMDPNAETIGYLSKQGILVAAGHTNASVDELRRAIDSGLKCFTHLGNGCPAELPRHDNIIHRVMSLRDALSVTLIADGFHLPIWMLRMIIDWFGIERTIIVSDAISAAGLPSGFHTLGSRRVWVGEDGVPRSEDRTHFVGSGATLDRMLSILQETALHGKATWSECDLEKLFRGNATKLLATSQSNGR